MPHPNSYNTFTASIPYRLACPYLLPELGFTLVSKVACLFRFEACCST